MAASKAIKTIGTMLRIQSKRKTKAKQNCKETAKNSYHLIGLHLSVQI